MKNVEGNYDEILSDLDCAGTRGVLFALAHGYDPEHGQSFNVGLFSLNNDSETCLNSRWTPSANIAQYHEILGGEEIPFDPTVRF